MFQFLEIHLFWLKIQNFIKKPPPTAYEILLISVFNLKQACKIVPTVKFKTRFAYFFHSKLDKVYQVIKSVTILRFERDWDKLWAKFRSYRQSVTKYLAKNKKIKET